MQAILMLAVVALCVITLRLVSGAVERLGRRKGVDAYRIKYIVKTLNLSVVVLYAIAASIVLGLEYSQVMIFLSSVFAVIGVALFAQWSILSNITASLIIFFGFPYRVGDYIKVVDKEDDISGSVEEITLFHVLIKRGEELITYPNTQILQKAVIKMPKGYVPEPKEVEKEVVVEGSKAE